MPDRAPSVEGKRSRGWPAWRGPQRGTVTRRIGFQGERGAYSEEAVLAHDEDADPIAFDRLEGAFAGVARGEIDAAVVPVENSQAGSINRTYDLLRRHDVHITGEIVLPVDHCLLALPGRAIEDLDSVRSHPQALEQCAAFLDEHGLEPVAASDTAGAAREIAAAGDGSVGALAAERAAELHGLDVLARAVQTIEPNWTRFVVLGPDPAPPGEGPHKTSLVFATEHTPGALYQALGHLAEREVNLLKLESRPSRRRPWEYVFYVDLEGHRRDENVRQALADLAENAQFVRVLGSYERGDEPGG